mmetsp:Transcript_77452/g.221822  ORF Transcript_77452/g.221822 Transcript_77452/m.221822 type:complete len:206 (+) Transcript_77452:1051-1668(+)
MADGLGGRQGFQCGTSCHSPQGPPCGPCDKDGQIGPFTHARGLGEHAFWLPHRHTGIALGARLFCLHLVHGRSDVPPRLRASRKRVLHLEMWSRRRYHKLFGPRVPGALRVRRGVLRQHVQVHVHDLPLHARRLFDARWQVHRGGLQCGLRRTVRDHLRRLDDRCDLRFVQHYHRHFCRLHDFGSQAQRHQEEVCAAVREPVRQA